MLTELFIYNMNNISLTFLSLNVKKNNTTDFQLDNTKIISLNNFIFKLYNLTCLHIKCL